MKGNSIYHESEAVVSDDGDEHQQKQADPVASPHQGVGNSNDAAPDNGIYIIEWCLRERR